MIAGIDTASHTANRGSVGLGFLKNNHAISTNDYQYFVTGL
jgi:hypothetical protein